MTDPWRSELWRIIFVVAGSLVSGLAVGTPFLVASITLSVYLAWHLTQAYRLTRWLRSDPVGSDPPATAGIWREIYRRFGSRFDDLTDRKLVLQQQMNQYRQVARALPDAAVAFDRHGAIELINDAAKRLFALREPEDLGRPIKNLIRVPQFVEYLERERFDTPLEIASPADAEITLSVKVPRLPSYFRRIWSATEKPMFASRWTHQ